jgi:hypothetical protein
MDRLIGSNYLRTWSNEVDNFSKAIPNVKILRAVIILRSIAQANNLPITKFKDEEIEHLLDITHFMDFQMNSAGLNYIIGENLLHILSSNSRMIFGPRLV